MSVKAYYDGIKHKQKDDVLSSILEAAKSGAIFGGIGGVTSGLIGGERSLRSIGMRGLGGAAGLAATAAGGGALGTAILGAPDQDEKNAYAKRGGLGGAIAGTAAGAGLGYILGAGKLKPWTTAAGRLAREFEAPIDNLIGDQVKKGIQRQSLAGGLATGAGLGALGGVAGGYMGMNEGMGVDFLHDNPNEIRQRRANVER